MAQNCLTFVSDLQGGRTRHLSALPQQSRLLHRGYMLEESLADIYRNAYAPPWGAAAAARSDVRQRTAQRLAARSCPGLVGRGVLDLEP